MVDADAAAAPPEQPERLHENHGKACANPECRKTLVTGKIRGVICTRSSCKTWADKAGIIKKYKTKAAAKENCHPQQPWVDGRRAKVPSVLHEEQVPGQQQARSAEQQAPHRPQVVLKEVHSIDGVSKALGTDRHDLDCNTIVYFVEGVYCIKVQRRVMQRWVAEAELHGVLSQSADDVHAEMASLWCPTFRLLPATTAAVPAAATAATTGPAEHAAAQPAADSVATDGLADSDDTDDTPSTCNGWTLRISRSSAKPYFYNAETGESTSSMPPGVDKDIVFHVELSSTPRPASVALAKSQRSCARTTA